MPAKAGIQFLAKRPNGRKLLNAGPKLQFAISSYRSRQLGFVFSINSNFQARFHFLICRSRVKADSLDSCVSYQTKSFTPWSFVNPERTSSLCIHTRLTRSSVIPTYKVPFLLLARM